jgi:ADP-ribose pyrophosphatase YjhB (NUDIX family)/nicotinamide mononucleotide adenylyltransferase
MAHPFGGVVARFQVPRLTPGQRHLVETVAKEHEDIAIFLGDHGGVRTRKDPLTFNERAIMVRQEFPNLNLIIKRLRDHPFSSDRWSVKLDELIADTIPERRGIILYGGRQSFIPLYSTKTHKCIEIPEFVCPSGTEVRNALRAPDSYEGRAAICYELATRPPFTYTATDLGIIDLATDEVFLIGKEFYDGLLSFPGGHVEKGIDQSLVAAAWREGGEEILGIEFTEPETIGTMPVDDPRMRDTPDGYVTTLCSAIYKGGDPIANDDAKWVERVHRSKARERLVPWHYPLWDVLNDNWPTRIAA